MDAYQKPAITFYGPGILTWPVDFIFAKTVGQQVDALYRISDAPGASQQAQTKALRMVQKVHHAAGIK